MVQVRLRVRPTAAYHAPNKVETITIDSHERLEKIQEKYSTAGNGSKTRLYFQGRELPLNSSVASQDFQDDDTLECCNSPVISAALSACMKDLEEVKKLSYTRRHPGVLKQLLEVSTDVRNDSEHGIWVSSNWTDDKIKSRTINFAIMKAVVQRKDRWAVHDLPQCNDCQSLYDALQRHNVWKGGNDGNASRAFRSQEHLFKPFKNNGEASTNWIMLWKKIDIMKRIQRTGYDSSAEDYIEEFVRRDSERHRSISAAINDEDAYLATHLNSIASSSPARSLPPRNQQPRSSNDSSLMDLSSPQRSTSRQPSSTPRSRQSKLYFPQYASGPFSVLAALHLAMHAKHKHSNGRRLLSLTEDEMKRHAQRRCRSNLYDKGRIRGRSAFACMDGLVEKQLARKEIIRDSNRDEIEKWGLLTKGENLGRICADFDRAVQHTIPDWNVQATLRCIAAKTNLTLFLDNREDSLFLRRLKQSCEDENISFDERDLPAGDYLFVDQSGMQECILPIVIERKSWSDLADSVLGKGRAAQRLECVKVGSHSNECSGNCQLDKMKRSGCSKILFIVEGERCLGSDSLHRSAPKCTAEKCCSACKSLEERHGIRQDVLEEVLTRLQVEHGCFIHYTKCFNETTQSLFDMRSLLQSAASFEDNILYETYASNARKRSTDENHPLQIPNNIRDVDVKSLAAVIKDRKWEQSLLKDIFDISSTKQQVSVPCDVPSRPRKRNKPSTDAIVLDDSDGSDGGIEMLDSTVSKTHRKQSESSSLINIAGDSDKDEASVDCIDLSESQDPLPPPPNGNAFIDLCGSQQAGVSHIRGGGYSDDTDKSDDDSVIELLNESQDSLPLPSGFSCSKDSTRKPKRRAVSCLGESSLETKRHMLILREWSQYDDNFHKAIEKAWKDVLSAANVTDEYESQQMNEIYAESVIKLKTLVGSRDFPLIARRHLLAFTLWVQLILGVQIRTVQRVAFADQIQRMLEKCGSATVSTSRFTPAPTHNTSSRATSSLSRDEASVSKASLSVPAAASMKRPITAVTKESSFVPAAASMKRPAATSLESDLIREARLKRFGLSSKSQSSSMQHQGSRYEPSPIVRSTADSTKKWECTQCSMKNEKEVCDACEAWRCSTCTYVNKSSAPECICGSGGPATKSAADNLSSSYDAVGSNSYFSLSSMKPSPSHNRSSFAGRKQPPEDGAKKAKVCGACGEEGHNRGNATQYNCTAYFEPKEVERREKLERKRLEKLDAEREKIERLERESGNAAQNYEEWLRQTEKIKKSHEQADEYRKEELKRAKQKKARMEKQQQRRNNGH